MYETIVKKKCTRFDILKNLLDDRRIQHNYSDMMEMPHKSMTYLKVYCSIFERVEKEIGRVGGGVVHPPKYS